MRWLPTIRPRVLLIISGPPIISLTGASGGKPKVATRRQVTTATTDQTGWRAMSTLTTGRTATAAVPSSPTTFNSSTRINANPSRTRLILVSEGVTGASYHTD